MAERNLPQSHTIIERITSPDSARDLGGWRDSRIRAQPRRLVSRRRHDVQVAQGDIDPTIMMWALGVPGNMIHGPSRFGFAERPVLSAVAPGM